MYVEQMTPEFQTHERTDRQNLLFMYLDNNKDINSNKTVKILEIQKNLRYFQVTRNSAKTPLTCM